MLFFVCLNCLEVYDYEEGHRCTDISGKKSETDPANGILIRATPTNGTGNITNSSLKSNSSSKGNFKFSVVTSKSGNDIMDIEKQAKDTDFVLRTSDNSSNQHNPIPSTSKDSFISTEQTASIQEVNQKPRNLSAQILQSNNFKKKCNICGKMYTEVYPHNIEQKCIVCGKRFNCRTNYNEHLLEHPAYFMTRCWICTDYMENHLSKDGKKIYKCCACDIQDSNVSNLKFHNDVSHKPKLRCRICQEEYKQEQQELHSGSFPCSVCNDTFDCHSLLEDHCSKHHLEYMMNHCFLCQIGLHKPISDHEQNGIYKCCQCSYEPFKNHILKLKHHLQTHSDTKLFKCDKCGRRYDHKNALGKHSKNCIPFNFKCEICRLSFDSEVSLHAHHSKNHLYLKDSV